MREEVTAVEPVAMEVEGEPARVEVEPSRGELDLARGVLETAGVELELARGELELASMDLEPPGVELEPARTGQELAAPLNFQGCSLDEAMVKMLVMDKEGVTNRLVLYLLDKHNMAVHQPLMEVVARVLSWHRDRLGRKVMKRLSEYGRLPRGCRTCAPCPCPPPRGSG